MGCYVFQSLLFNYSCIVVELVFRINKLDLRILTLVRIMKILPLKEFQVGKKERKTSEAIHLFSICTSIAKMMVDNNKT